MQASPPLEKVSCSATRLPNLPCCLFTRRPMCSLSTWRHVQRFHSETHVRLLHSKTHMRPLHSKTHVQPLHSETRAASPLGDPRTASSLEDTRAASSQEDTGAATSHDHTLLAVMLTRQHTSVNHPRHDFSTSSIRAASGQTSAPSSTPVTTHKLIDSGDHPASSSTPVTTRQAQQPTPDVHQLHPRPQQTFWREVCGDSATNASEYLLTLSFVSCLLINVTHSVILIQSFSVT